jgi:hypothetical protein
MTHPVQFPLQERQQHAYDAWITMVTYRLGGDSPSRFDKEEANQYVSELLTSGAYYWRVHPYGAHWCCGSGFCLRCND